MPSFPVYGFTPALGTPVPAVTKRTQLVAEVTPGTTPGSPSWKRMPTLMITPGQKFGVEKFRGQGYKYPSQVILGKEWVDFKYDGAATFAELAYIWSSYVSNAAITTLGTTAKQWAFTPQPNNPDAGTTYSMQHGDSTGGWAMTYGRFASCTMTITRDGVKVSGEGLGQYWNTGVTLGSSPTTVENVPLIANTVNVSLDTVYGSLGTTQLKSPFEIEVGFPNRFNPIFPLNTTSAGHAGDVEIPSEPTLKMKIAADAQSDALVAQLRVAGLYYLQIQIISAIQADAAGPTFYSLFLTFPIQVGDHGGFSDSGGIYVADWTENMVVDVTNNFIWKANLINKTASL